MILRFGAQLDYEGPNTFILSKNLMSALADTGIIDKKLAEDLRCRQVEKVTNPTLPFISSPLGLVPKHDGGWRKIHHLSHPVDCSVNDHIPDGAGEMRYTRFQDVLQMVIRTGRNCIILKRDVKDAFKNVPVASHQQWLLGFMWEERYYKETCLSFGLSTTPFIFNFFGKSLHWVLVSYLRWILVHYLDDFVSVFSASQAEQIWQARHAYNWVTDLPGIPRNDSKDAEGMQVIVFGIEIDTRKFTAKLSNEKLEKAVKATSKVLAEQSVTFLDIQSLVGFLSFCSQAVCLGKVFMRRLWDFVNEYPWAATKLTRRRIPGWVREDLEWWNDLLPAYNGVLFVDTCSRHTINLYTDTYLYGLGGFFFEGRGDWPTNAIDQVNAFQAIVSGKTLPLNWRMAKNPDDPSINVHKVEAILLAF